MRVSALAIAAVSLSWSAALAGAKDDSRALYSVVAQSSAAFVQLLDEVPTSPAAVADRLRSEVSQPVAKQNALWMTALREDVEGFLPFMPCNGAAISLDEMAGKLRRFFLQQAGKPDLDHEIGYFREEITRCERALGLAATFPDEAERLAKEEGE